MKDKDGNYISPNYSKDENGRVVVTVPYHSTTYEHVVPGDKPPFDYSNAKIAVPEPLKHAAELIYTKEEIEELNDDWAYDEAKDNELQDRLAAQEPNNNPVY